METKKVQPTVIESSPNTDKIKEFVSDIKSEIGKVHWTSRQELLTYTKIVIVATLAFGMAIYFVDMFIQTVLSALSWFIQTIAG